MSRIEEALRDRLSPARPDPPLSPGVPAAVIVPVIDGAEPTVLLTRRTDLVRDHKGEISFPGGVRHPEDPDLVTTALRETEEELGVPASAIEVLGALPPTHTIVTGYVIAPFVGLLREAPPLTPSAVEIAEVLHLGLARLVEAEREVDVAGRTTYAFEVGGDLVWGATGWILHGLIAALRSGGWSASPEEDPRRG